MTLYSFFCAENKERTDLRIYFSVPRPRARHEITNSRIFIVSDSRVQQSEDITPELEMSSLRVELIMPNCELSWPKLNRERSKLKLN